ncbi:MAG: glycerol-3-phosphate O-acyltransferase [Pseudonocardiales bacterium]|jgi:glycerol-3-phosphate O-acyltransferase|nr:glycerol-3-phosphate O-acyltransferase [Pseudonocardiales bacterium]
MSRLFSDPPIVLNILRSDAFRQQADELGQRLGMSAQSVADEVATHLNEMAATHNQRVIDRWTRFGQWMLRGYDLLIDEEGLAGLRALDDRHSLVFLIAHRSYLDEWVVPPALMTFGIRAPFGVAGANLNFFPLGTVARRTGIVHIRRATADMPVYRFALRTFISQLVSTRANLIWSIEGGRSRTGKLRPPRLGLLNYVVEAAAQVDEEVQLVPVSIIYDQLPGNEVELMTSEARGHGKTPENVRWFVRYLRGLRRRLGRIYVDFGEPIALKQRVAELTAEDPSGAHTVERVALEVCHRINVATPVTPTAAVCIALLAADRALTLDEILATVTPLAEFLQARGSETAGAATLTDRATLRRAAQDLVCSGVLTSNSTGASTVWVVGPQQHLVAAMYRNSAIHTLVQRAIVELVLLGGEDATIEEPYDARGDALRLRDLLKFEFFFAPRQQFLDELRDELRLIDPEIRFAPGAHLTDEQAKSYLASMKWVLAHLVLRPFIDAYSIVAHQLLDLGDAGVLDQDRFIAQCLSIGHQWALRRRIASEESNSAEMFRTALRLAANRELLDEGAQDLAVRRREFVDEIQDVQRKLDEVASLRRS